MIKKIISTRILFAGTLAAGLVGAISSCSRPDDPNHTGYEYMPDMYRSPSYETYSGNPNFPDSMTARQPVYGTIPRGNGGYIPYPYPNTPEGYEAAGKELKNPFPTSEECVARGKEVFEIYCIHCHGAEGHGDGTIVANGKFAPPPSYADKLKDLPEGKIFHSITYGKNMMGSHASQVNVNDRWKLVQYVQKLQKGGAAGVPADSTKKIAQK